MRAALIRSISSPDPQTLIVARDHEVELEKRSRQRKLLDEQIRERLVVEQREKQDDLRVN